MIAHKHIRQQSTLVKVRIITTFRQTGRHNKETTYKILKSVYILIATWWLLWLVQFVRSHTFQIYMHLILNYKIMYLMPEDVQCDRHVACID